MIIIMNDENESFLVFKKILGKKNIKIKFYPWSNSEHQETKYQ